MSTEMLGLLRDISAKQDHLVDRVGKLETAVAVDVEMTKLARADVNARIARIEKELAEDIKPQTDEMKRMKTVGVSVLAMVGMAGLSLGGMLMWAGDTAVAYVRAWLHIR